MTEWQSVTAIIRVDNQPVEGRYVVQRDELESRLVIECEGLAITESNCNSQFADLVLLVPAATNRVDLLFVQRTKTLSAPVGFPRGLARHL